MESTIAAPVATETSHKAFSGVKKLPIIIAITRKLVPKIMVKKSLLENNFIWQKARKERPINKGKKQMSVSIDISGKKNKVVTQPMSQKMMPITALNPHR